MCEEVNLDVFKCNHCGKEIPYPQVGVDFHFFHNVNDMDETDRETHVHCMGTTDPYIDLRFVQNFIAPCLCYDCAKELENNLIKFIEETEEREKSE